MKQAPRASVPWCLGAVPRTLNEHTGHSTGDLHGRFRYARDARRRRWRDPDALVHETEAMANPSWGADRLTLCRVYCLNEHPQASCTSLDIVGICDALTCLGCLSVVPWLPVPEVLPETDALSEVKV